MQRKFRPDPDPEHKDNAGRMEWPNEDICIVNMIAEHIPLVLPPQTVTWSTYRDPNPAEKKAIELVVAITPGVKMSVPEAIQQTCDACAKTVKTLHESFKLALSTSHPPSLKMDEKE